MSQGFRDFHTNPLVGDVFRRHILGHGTRDRHILAYDSATDYFFVRDQSPSKTAKTYPVNKCVSRGQLLNWIQTSKYIKGLD